MKDATIASALLVVAIGFLAMRNLTYLVGWLLVTSVVLVYGARLKYTPAVVLSIVTVLAVIFLSGQALRERFEDKMPEDEREIKKEERERPQSDTTFDPEPHIDMGTTIMDAYKKMKPAQIAQMQADTKELMETQQQLIQTLSMLGPQVQQGAELIKTFQGMFGGNITDVLKQ